MSTMKKCEKYNMKKAFEEKRDFDFTIYMVIHSSFVSRSTKLIPVYRFTLFAITVLEASKIALLSWVISILSVSLKNSVSSLPVIILTSCLSLNMIKLLTPILKLYLMKLTNEQWHKIITAVCTVITTISAIVLSTACTISLSVSKNNSNSSQKTEQTSTSSVDSTYINLNK